jgi:MSHA biogenesis protein MshO
MPCPEHSRERGVTLIEMVIVISITAIIAGAVSVFISRPVEGYADAARRAEMSDIADTALRRITRDLRTALANSIRITCVPAGCAAGSVYYLEYLQSSGGGRYRAEKDSSGGGNILDFTIVDPDGFDVIGTMPALAAGDSIVIYNLAASGATANAYVGDNRAAYSSVTPPTITLAPTKQFPFSSPGKRFNVVQYAVTYACNPTTHELRRYWGYGIVDPQQTPPATPNNALLASNVAACSFTYALTGAAQRTGVVMLSLQIQESGSNDSIQLFQQVHVTNVP